MGEGNPGFKMEFLNTTSKYLKGTNKSSYSGFHPGFKIEFLNTAINYFKKLVDGYLTDWFWYWRTSWEDGYLGV